MGSSPLRDKGRSVRTIAPFVVLAWTGAFAVACLGDDPAGGPALASADDAAAQDGAAESAAGDASPDDGADAAGDAGQNLLDNAGFELGCAGWNGAGATVAEDGVARSGAKSCRVCSDGTQSYYYAVRTVDRDLVPGERYVAGAWLRATDDAPSDPGMLVSLKTISPAQTNVEDVSSAAPLLGATWQHATCTITIEEAGTQRLDVYIGSQAPTADGGCFLVDDVSLVRNP